MWDKIVKALAAAGGDRLEKVEPKDWIHVNVGGDVLWIGPKSIVR